MNSPRTRSIRVLVALAVLGAGGVAVAAESSPGPWDGDFFADALSGLWNGTGIVHGNDDETPASRPNGGVSSTVSSANRSTRS